MCEYCNIRNQNEILGKNFDLQNTAGFKHDRVYSSWIMKNKADKNAGIMIATNGGNAVYFDIQFCPMCRKEIKRCVNIVMKYGKILKGTKIIK